MAIRSFRDSRTEGLFLDVFDSGIAVEIQRQAVRKMQIIEAATSLWDLRSPPGNRLEALKGGRKGQWSIRVNRKWRLCFRWVEGAAENLELVDYHAG